MSLGLVPVVPRIEELPPGVILVTLLEPKVLAV
jgi:hypothetical protein